MSTDDLEALDLISAIWILACHDENHLLTFEGIRERLGLSTQYDVRGLVLKRRELFRPGAPPGELEEWKNDMQADRRVPSWIRQMQQSEARRQAIAGLGANDVFRSQFRAGRTAPSSPIEVVAWGLDHLDRLRTSRIALLNATAKSWQMWLVFLVGLANIVVSIVLALWHRS
jgi:hypothetical protein